MKINLSLLPQYFQMVKSGLKTVEGRLKESKFERLKIGETICFSNAAEKKEWVNVKITHLHTYPSFRQMLIKEGVENCLPGKKNIEEAVKIYHSFPGYQMEESKQGVLAIGIRLVHTEPAQDEKIR